MKSRKIHHVGVGWGETEKRNQQTTAVRTNKLKKRVSLKVSTF